MRKMAEMMQSEARLFFCWATPIHSCSPDQGP